MTRIKDEILGVARKNGYEGGADTIADAIRAAAPYVGGGSGGGESSGDTSGSDIYKVTMTGSLTNDNPQTGVTFDKTPDEMRQAALDGKLVWLFHKLGTTTYVYLLKSSNTYQGGIQLNFFCSIGSKEFHILISTRYPGDSGTVSYYSYNISLSNS